jgi:hypothetical protein
MIDKKRYTVSSPPRVHEVARAVGCDSKYTMTMLWHYTKIDFRTPSHKVPLSTAIGFIQWLKSI